MSDHTCRTLDSSCYRCDLSRDEVTGGMVDLLAAHQEEANDAGLIACQCGGYSGSSPDEMAAHQETVLRSAGFGDTRALLDDLRVLAAVWSREYEEQQACAQELLALLARHDRGGER